MKKQKSKINDSLALEIGQHLYDQKKCLLLFLEDISKVQSSSAAYVFTPEGLYYYGLDKKSILIESNKEKIISLKKKLSTSKDKEILSLEDFQLITTLTGHVHTLYDLQKSFTSELWEQYKEQSKTEVSLSYFWKHYKEIKGPIPLFLPRNRKKWTKEEEEELSTIGTELIQKKACDLVKISSSVNEYDLESLPGNSGAAYIIAPSPDIINEEIFYYYHKETKKLTRLKLQSSIDLEELSEQILGNKNLKENLSALDLHTITEITEHTHPLYATWKDFYTDIINRFQGQSDKTEDSIIYHYRTELNYPLPEIPLEKISYKENKWTEEEDKNLLEIGTKLIQEKACDLVQISSPLNEYDLKNLPGNAGSAYILCPSSEFIDEKELVYYNKTTHTLINLELIGFSFDLEAIEKLLEKNTLKENLSTSELKLISDMTGHVHPLYPTFKEFWEDIEELLEEKRPLNSIINRYNKLEYKKPLIMAHESEKISEEIEKKMLEGIRSLNQDIANCDVIKTDTLPENLNELSGKSIFSYVFTTHDSQLFYCDKSINKFIQIPILSEEFSEMEETLKNLETQSEKLAYITSITGHSHFINHRLDFFERITQRNKIDVNPETLLHYFCSRSEKKKYPQPWLEKQNEYKYKHNRFTEKEKTLFKEKVILLLKDNPFEQELYKFYKSLSKHLEKKGSKKSWITIKNMYSLLHKEEPNTFPSILNFKEKKRKFYEENDPNFIFNPRSNKKKKNIKNETSFNKNLKIEF